MRDELSPDTRIDEWVYIRSILRMEFKFILYLIVNMIFSSFNMFNLYKL